MEKLLEKLQTKWIAIILAVFILGRALTALISPEFGTEILSDGGQVHLYGLTFTYIGNTILLPLIFALLTVEFTGNKLSPILFRVVLGVHFVSVIVAVLITGMDSLSFGSTPMQGGSEGISIINSNSFYRSLIMLALTVLTSVLAYYWQKTNYRVFLKQQSNA